MPGNAAEHRGRVEQAARSIHLKAVLDEQRVGEEPHHPHVAIAVFSIHIDQGQVMRADFFA